VIRGTTQEPFDIFRDNVDLDIDAAAGTLGEKGD
jgi:hypothetical protein